QLSVKHDSHCQICLCSKRCLCYDGFPLIIKSTPFFSYFIDQTNVIGMTAKGRERERERGGGGGRG
ncbi:unnamed protein product, partial [Musa acuminata var. zebrina]